MCGKNVTFTRKDLINFLGLEDCEDSIELALLGRQQLFNLLNDGYETKVDRDVFVLQFPLIVRLLHKIVCSCLLPKQGSRTSISVNEAKIILGMIKGKKVDIAGKILVHALSNAKSKLMEI